MPVVGEGLLKFWASENRIEANHQIRVFGLSRETLFFDLVTFDRIYCKQKVSSMPLGQGYVDFGWPVLGNSNRIGPSELTI